MVSDDGLPSLGDDTFVTQACNAVNGTNVRCGKPMQYRVVEARKVPNQSSKVLLLV